MQIELLKTKEDITKELNDEIFEKCLQTGSTIFGGVTETSDIDFILTDTEDELFNKLKPFGIIVMNYDIPDMVFRTMYVKYKKDIFNIIFVKDEKFFVIWEKAQYLFLELNKNSEFKRMIQKKEFRISIFETFRNFYGWKPTVKVSMTDLKEITDVEI